MRLKTKLTLSLFFLFTVILIFGIMGIFYVTRLGKDADVVLKDNQESLMYCNNMLKALEDIPGRQSAFELFNQNLKAQEKNITEIGESEATNELSKNFGELIANPRDSSNYPQIRQSIHIITDLNQQAITRKNTAAKKTAASATIWLSIVFTILTLLALTLVVNLPGVISNPIKSLSEGISEIANRNYQKRIFLKNKDEFGDLANAFNEMAEKLNGYENSSLAKITFEKKRIEAIINQMKDGIVGLDEKRNILFLNEVSEKIFGLKEKNIIGKYAPDIALKNDLMRTILQDEEIKKDLKIYADNKESYFNKDIIHVKNNEQTIGQVIVLRNITPFHELNEAKTNFIATVSHELKTPISSIKMSAKLLTDNRVSELNADQRELTKSIIEDADRLLKITGEILNLSQVETGNIQLKFQPTKPETIIETALESVQFQADQKKVILKKQLSNDLPQINADVEKISWVMINLLTNAIKYSTSESAIDINVEKQNGQVIFSVKDYGPGIAKEYLPRLFERYFQVPGSIEKGTGLGLAISKDFVEAQHGKIWVESEPGKGSAFSFALPC